MKYDTLAIQAFQEALEKVEKEPITDQAGICYYIKDFYGYQEGKLHETIGYEVIEWMRDTYFPSAYFGNYWWPINPYEFDKKKLLDSKMKRKMKRIHFLQRIIEDLMCGE